MSQQRLNELSLLSIEKKMLNVIDYVKLTNDFKYYF